MLKTILFMTIIFLSNIIQTITGFAGTLIAMPPLIFLFDINTVKPILNVLGIFVSFFIVVISFKDIVWKEIIKVLIFMFLGLLIGLWLYKQFPVEFSLKIYSIFIIFIALKSIFVKNDKSLPDIIFMLIILIAGIMHGMFVSGGPLLMIYLINKLPQKKHFRASISTVWVILNSSLAYTHYLEGLFTTDVIKLILMALPALVLGMIAGNKLHNKIPQNVFLKLTYFLLLVSGVSLLLK